MQQGHYNQGYQQANNQGQPMYNNPQVYNQQGNFNNQMGYNPQMNPQNMNIHPNMQGQGMLIFNNKFKISIYV